MIVLFRIVSVSELNSLSLAWFVAESKLMFFLISMPEPSFVSMVQMPESDKSEEGDDDKVYLFFSETAVECDCYNKLVVSRVARVCKVIKTLPCTLLCFPTQQKYINNTSSRVLIPPFLLLAGLDGASRFFWRYGVHLCSQGDLGGQRTLQKKWTSFLKARLDCPVLDSQLPYIIQDTYLWCDPQQHWKECLFYAIFTPQAYVLN